ncbi:hypothetical protein CVT26_002240 [Gymnopilus dilepis]|uniref:GATA-type domain-containing protein n=1 Tax=Gymnopilus dilepis TaxID=231916 RepID=A0A409YN03_9AGAR|nr:hypothetical protein CVT26_002240 [Gymnopilus dilepis]
MPQWGKVKIANGGDLLRTQCCSHEDMQERNMSYIRYELLVKTSKTSQEFDREVFYGRLEMILEFQAPDDNFWGQGAGKTILMAVVTPCVTGGKDAAKELTIPLSLSSKLPTSSTPSSSSSSTITVLNARTSSTSSSSSSSFISEEETGTRSSVQASLLLGSSATAMGLGGSGSGNSAPRGVKAECSNCGATHIPLWRRGLRLLEFSIRLTPFALDLRRTPIRQPWCQSSHSSCPRVLTYSGSQSDNPDVLCHYRQYTGAEWQTIFNPFMPSFPALYHPDHLSQPYGMNRNALSFSSVDAELSMRPRSPSLGQEEEDDGDSFSSVSSSAFPSECASMEFLFSPYITNGTIDQGPALCSSGNTFSFYHLFCLYYSSFGHSHVVIIVKT